MDVEFGRRGFHLAVTAEEGFQRVEERPIRGVAVEGIQRVCEKFQFAAISDAQEHPENIEVIEFAESTVCVGPGGSPGLIETEVQVAQGCR